MHQHLRLRINLVWKAAICGFLFIVLGCSTQKHMTFAFEKTLAPLHQQEVVIPKGWEKAPAYLEILKTASNQDEAGLVLEGQLPTACNRLWITGNLSADTLTLHVESIRNSKEVCSMALEPFSVFVPFSYFELTEKQRSSITSISAQNFSISLK